MASAIFKRLSLDPVERAGELDPGFAFSSPTGVNFIFRRSVFTRFQLQARAPKSI
jgi:hypothetical protein